ncbi:MAG: DUF4363 family protein [Clostridium sp.]
MRNAIASILLFLIIMLFVKYANNELIAMCESIITQSLEIEFQILQEDWENAFISSGELLNTIKENETLTSIYLNHQDLDHLSDEALRLNIFSECRTIDEALISVHHLKYSAINIKELHKLSFKNIF